MYFAPRRPPTIVILEIYMGLKSKIATKHDEIMEMMIQMEHVSVWLNSVTNLHISDDGRYVLSIWKSIKKIY